MSRLVIIGAGPAGLAAAEEAALAGVEEVIVLERDERAGGILNQCIHSGFGLHIFKEELTGPEYAERFINKALAAGVKCLTGCFVTSITRDRKVTYVNSQGVFTLQADAVILTCGCRERPRGAINIPGARCSGIFSAGTAQKLINMQGFMPGRKAVILGSGDIGLIMARRMTLQGAQVLAVAELMPYSSGLNRNIVQCLDDFGIPLLLSHTVTDIRAKDGRLCSVTVSAVDSSLNPVAGSEKVYECDTLLLSVGLVPETELERDAGISLDPVTGGAVTDETMMTDAEGIFSAGNMLHVHDLADFACMESRECARYAVEYMRGRLTCGDKVKIECGEGIRYTVPRYVSRALTGGLSVKLRTTCVRKNTAIAVEADGCEIYRMKKRSVAPGEMEYITLPESAARSIRSAEKVIIKLSEGV